MKILDLGAGAGEYSLYFANKGYHVNAVELADKNVANFRAKITDGLTIDLRHGNALDLSDFEDETFDIALLFGPLYHLHDERDRNTAIQEAKRVLKKTVPCLSPLLIMTCSTTRNGAMTRIIF